MSEQQALASAVDDTPGDAWRSYFSRRNGLAWTVLAIALLADLGAWFYLHQREQAAARHQFELLAEEISDAIRKRMTDHEQILLGGAGLFDASADVDRQEWNTYISRLKLADNYPGIQGVGFSRFLHKEQLDAFEAAVREEGFHSFRVHPPGRRERYGAVLFLEPFSDRNLAAFGFDMLSEPTRQAAMLDAARSGQTRISSRVTLLQETHGKVQPGLLMYVPVYRQGQPLDTPEQRLQALYGFVYSPYRMHDLMAGILDGQPPGLDFAIHAGDAGTAENLLYASRSSSRHEPLLTSERELSLYGQTWTLRFSSPPDFDAGFHRDLPMLLLGGGVALLLFFIATLLTQRRVQAEALARKMTERIHQSSAALRQSEERLRLVLRGSNDGWWDLDLLAGRFFASERAWEMLGYPPEEHPQPLDRWRQALHPDDLAGLQDRLREALDSGADAFSHEARLQHRDGRELTVLLRGFIQRDAAGHAVRISGTTLDLSERKRVERMKNEFVSTVSHELRTPLTSITGALGLINGGALGAVPPLMQQMLDIAQQNSQRLGHLINDLLDMDKLSAGKMIFDLRVQAIRPLIQEALIGNQAYAEKHGVNFRLDLPGEMQVRVDGLRLQQVLGNFLSNAIKFSPPGTSVNVLGELRGSRVRISVSDHGPGIPEAFRTRIFQRFAQADGTDQRVQPGTGLGLAISKELMERMGGSVGFHSEEGQGATFWLELPLVEQQIPPSGVPVGVGGAQVLVVEDEPGIARLLQVMLGQAGYRVDCRINTAQAREALANGNYAAMTLDLRLPDDHGAAFIREVRGKPATADMPILVVSAYCDEGRKLLGKLAEEVDWLDKPIDHQRLLKILDERIAGVPLPGKTGEKPDGYDT